VFSGMTLDIFNRHPEKVAMANCAQLINCLNSLYLAHEDKFVVTPVGHVLGMYAGHQGGQSVRTLFSAPSVNYDRDGKPAMFWGLRGSASVKDKNLFLTVVNPHVTEARESEIVLRGARVRSGTVTTLTHSDIHAHNTFEQRDVVMPQTKELKTGGSLVLTFPPASVTAVNAELA
jgi:alpha-N-arabinofuranosidase